MLVHDDRCFFATLFGAALLSLALGAPPEALASPACPQPEITSITPASVPAAGGVHLTINGANFLAGGGCKVGIGIAHPPIVSMTDQQIVVIAPPQLDEAEPEVVVYRGLRPHPNVVHLIGYAPPVVLPDAPVAARRGGGNILTIRGADFTCSAPGAYLASPTGGTCPARVLALTDTTVVVETGDCDDGDATAELHVTFARHQGIVHRDLAARNVLLEGGRAPSLSVTSVPSCGGTPLTIFGTDFQGTSGQPPRPQLCMDGTCRDLRVLSSSPTQIVAVSPPMSDSPLTAAATVRVITDGIAGAGCPLQVTAQPVVRALHTSSLPAAGGFPLTIRGENFADGATVRVGGITAGAIAGIAVGRTITCLSPPLPPGVTTVEAQQEGFISTTLHIEVLASPVITQVTPAVVSADGGVLLTVVGQNFGPGGAFRSLSVQVQQPGHAPVSCGPVRWMAPEMIECRAPAGLDGSADLLVTVNGVTTTMSHALTVLPGSVAVPILAGSNPPTLTREGGSLMTLTGSNFISAVGATRVRFGDRLVTPQVLTGNLLIFTQPALEEGEDPVAVEVHVGQRSSNPLYQGQTASGVNPLFGAQSSSQAGGTVITITGNDFGPQAIVACSSTSGESHEATPFDISPTQLSFHAPEFSSSGDVSVRVVHGALQSNPQPLPYAGPELSSLSVEEVSPAGGTVITITGSGFGAAPGQVSFGSDGVVVSSWSPTEIVGACASRAPGCPSTRPVRVTASDGSSSRKLPVRWTAPEVLTVDVPAVSALGGALLTIQGRDFSPYATLEWADGLPGPSFLVTERSPTSFSVLLGSGSAGGRLMSLDAASEPSGPPVSLELLSPPQLSSVSPPAGPIAGGNTMTVVGSGFGPPGTRRSVHFAGADDCPMSVTDEQADRITCTLPPGTGAGFRDLIVEVDGVADTLVGAYEYSATAGVGGGAPPRAALALAPLRSPFASELTLRLTLPQAGRWQVQLFDARGAQVRRLDGDAPAGTFDVRWDGRAADGRAAAPGVYFVRLASGGLTRETRAIKLN